jgi:hypothetical protein
MANIKLSAAAQAAVDQIKKDLDADYEQRKAEVEAAAKRKPWTVVAYSAAAGAILMYVVLQML